MGGLFWVYFLGLFLEPAFASNLGPNGEGGLSLRLPFLPPLTLSPLVLPLKGTPLQPPSAKALSGTLPPCTLPERNPVRGTGRAKTLSGTLPPSTPPEGDPLTASQC